MSVAEAEQRAGLPLRTIRRARTAVVEEVEGASPAQRRARHVVAVAVVAAGVLLRLRAQSPMWLDEAQTVSIGRLPLQQMFAALRQDGSPPLYYVLLHGWIRVFGQGTNALRLLSGVFSLASLPVGWQVARRLGGREVAWTTVVLLASSPFAIRYATETRMYELVILLVLLGTLAVLRALESPTRGRLAAVAAAAGALVLTHYWGAFLIAGAVLVLLAARRPLVAPRPARLVAAALVAGSASFVVWIPSFVFQVTRTGAPWGTPAGFSVPHVALQGFVGGTTQTGSLLELLLVGVVGFAVLAAPPSSWPRPLTAVAAITLTLGTVFTWLTGSAFHPRHAAVAFPAVVIAAAVGVTWLAHPWRRLALITAMAVLGLVAALPAVTEPRTQAGQIAAEIQAVARPGDIVAVCPDQLAPALARLLPGVPMRVLPEGSDPERVNWVDYDKRVADLDPAAEAVALNQAAGTGSVLLVWSPTYLRIGSRCNLLRLALQDLRPDGEELVRIRRSLVEDAWLWRG